MSAWADERTSVLRPSDRYCALVCMIVLVAGQCLLRDTTLDDLAARLPWFVLSIAAALMVAAIMLCPHDNRAFLYFQF